MLLNNKWAVRENLKQYLETKLKKKKSSDQGLPWWSVVNNLPANA